MRRGLQIQVSSLSEGRPLYKEEDKEVSPSGKRELILDKMNEPG